MVDGLGGGYVVTECGDRGYGMKILLVNTNKYLQPYCMPLFPVNYGVIECGLFQRE